MNARYRWIAATIWGCVLCLIAGCARHAELQVTKPDRNSRIQERLQLDNVTVVNVMAMAKENEAGDVRNTWFVLNRGGHDVATISCVDLYKAWYRDGTISRSVTANTDVLFKYDGLGVIVAAPLSAKASKLALLTFCDPGPDYKFGWCGTYLVRIDSEPKFMIVPLQEIKPLIEIDNDLPCIATFKDGMALVTTSYIQRLNVFGQPINKPVQAKNGTLFKYARDNWAGVFKHGKNGLKAQDVLFDLAGMRYRLPPESQGFQLDNKSFVNVIGMRLDAKVGDVKKTNLVLNRGGHDVAMISCLDLYKKWSKNGIMQHSVLKDANTYFGNGDLGVFVDAPLSQKTGKLALVVFSSLAIDYQHSWCGAYLVRIDTRPKFAVVPMQEIRPDKDYIYGIDRPRIVVLDSGPALVTDTCVQRLNAFGQPVGKPVQAKTGTVFGFMRDHLVSVFTSGGDRVKDVVFDLTGMRYRQMPVSQQQKPGVKYTKVEGDKI